MLNNLYVVPKIYGYTRVNLERGVNNSIEQGRLGTHVHSDRGVKLVKKAYLVKIVIILKKGILLKIVTK